MRLKKSHAALLRSAGWIALLSMNIAPLWSTEHRPLRSILHRLFFAPPRLSLMIVLSVVITVAWKCHVLRTASSRAILANRDPLPKTAKGYARRCAQYLTLNAAEEFIFRGAVIAFMWDFGLKAALALIPIQAALWALSHFTNPCHKENDRGITTADIINRAYTFLYGCLLGIMALLSGGILIPYLVHLFTNFLWNYELWKVQRRRKSPVAYAPAD